MKMLMNVQFPHEPFNTYVKDGTIGGKINDILADLKPEAVYFTEVEGKRDVVLIVDLANPSMVPALAEPWFLVFQADTRFRIVMSPEDLKAAGLDKLGEKWA